MSRSIRSAFRHYHRLSDAERTDLWERCTFAFDTNVLLNVYRYASSTREDLFRVLERLGERVWIPYQVASEFYRGRIDVIQEQRAKYSELRNELESSLKSLKGGGFHKSALLGIDQIVDVLRPAVDQAIHLVEGQRAQHPDLIHEDPYLERLVTLIGDHVGTELEKTLFDSRCTDAQARIEQQRPPGYRDAKKPTPDRYGDVLIWFELLEHAKATVRPIIFITEDDKDDWWQIVDGEKLGPRPELREEMRKVADVEFYLYNPALLLQSAGERLNLPVALSSVDDATKVATEQQETRLSRAHEPPPGKWSLLRSAGYSSGLGVGAEEAVYEWLISRNPSAEVLRVERGHFDFLLLAPSRSIAVEVKALRHSTPRTMSIRLRDSFLRAFYEISTQAVDDFQLYLVVENEKIGWEAAEALRSSAREPLYAVSIGIVGKDGVYAEVWRSPWGWPT